MKVNEIIASSGLKSFIAQVRCQLNGAGSSTLRFGFQSDSFASARNLLSMLFGKNNVLNVREVFGEDTTHPMSSTELQVKSLDDKAKQLKQQAKLVKAKNRMTNAQNQLLKANKTSM